MRQRGFTLIELITVMTLTGILAVYAASRFDRQSFDLSAARDEVIEALRYAQHQSMSHSGAMGYQVELLADGYRVELQNDTPVNDPLTGAPPYQRNWNGIAVAPLGNVAFNSRGAPAAAANISLSLGSDTLHIQVEALTGYVH